MILRLAWVFATFLFLSPVASAYIDPGSGLLLIQGLLAAVGGIVVFVRHPVETAKRWLQRLRDRRNA